MIKAKQKGHVLIEPVEDDADPLSDLPGALGESVAQQTQTGRSARSNAMASGSKGPTNAQLSQKATRKRAQGYSTMRKNDLLAAIR